MEKQFNIGRHNCFDEVMMKGCPADKVVAMMMEFVGESN